MSSPTGPISDQEFVRAIGELPNDALFTVKKDLETSILKLAATNEILEAELRNSLLEDKAMYDEVLRENEPIIRSKKRRLDILKNEMAIRGLIETRKKQ